jgi:ABC-type sugar transport system permease subunit
MQNPRLLDRAAPDATPSPGKSIVRRYYRGARRALHRIRTTQGGAGALYKGFLFTVPILLIFIVFKFFPIGQALWTSLTDASPLNPNPSFVGIKNYESLINDSQFWRSLRITLYYVLGTVAPLMIVSLGLALMLNQAFRGRSLYRLLLFLPSLVPWIVVPILWRFLFHPYGLANEMLGWVGIEPVSWLTTKVAVIPAFIIATEWRFVPLFMVVYLAGLQSISQEMYDAATVDGASVPRRFRSITLPLLKPTILVVLVMATTMTIRNLVLALVMTGGGPDDASTILPLFIFEQGFRLQRLGYANAASVVLLAIMIGFAAISLRVFQRDED